MTQRKLLPVTTILLCVSLLVGLNSGIHDARSDEADPQVTPQVRRNARQSVERALTWLANQQEPNGAFPTLEIAQPAVNSLCLLAFMANGHMPGEGPNADRLSRALEFVLSAQKPDGVFVYIPAGKTGPYDFSSSKTGCYNHAIAGVMLSELYGVADSTQSKRIGRSIEAALQYTLKDQREWDADTPYAGGWRYLNDFFSENGRADLSVTSWQLMFLRAAANAGFNIPEEPIEAAVGFVRRCYDSQLKSFRYSNHGSDREASCAMAGAGIVTLAQGGVHDTEMARNAGNYLLAQNFNRYNYLRVRGSKDGEYYHYSVFYGTFGTFQLGGGHWDSFYPRVVRILTKHQSRNGSWGPEGMNRERHFGRCYTTALIVLALSMENQLLPIFQR